MIPALLRGGGDHGYCRRLQLWSVAVLLGNLEATGTVCGVSLDMPGKEAYRRVVKRPAIVPGKTCHERRIDLGRLRFQSDSQTGDGNLPGPLVYHTPAPVGQSLCPGQHWGTAHLVTRVATGSTEVEDHVQWATPGIFFLREVFPEPALDFVARSLAANCAIRGLTWDEQKDQIKRAK